MYISYRIVLQTFENWIVTVHSADNFNGESIRLSEMPVIRDSDILLEPNSSSGRSDSKV